MIDVRKIAFDGRLDTKRASRNRIGLTFDSLLVAGRIAADTLGMKMDRLHVHEHNDHMDMHADASVLLATRAFGRMHIPISIKGTAGISKEDRSLALHGFKAEIASVPLDFDLDLKKKDGHLSLDGRFGVEECRIEELIDGFVKNIIPETADIRTDASISLAGTCSGNIGNGTIPAFNLSLALPEATASHKSLRHKINLAMKAEAGTGEDGKINLKIDEALLKTYGLGLKAGMSVSDITGEDPLIRLHGSLRA